MKQVEDSSGSIEYLVRQQALVSMAAQVGLLAYAVFLLSYLAAALSVPISFSCGPCGLACEGTRHGAN